MAEVKFCYLKCVAMIGENYKPMMALTVQSCGSQMLQVFDPGEFVVQDIAKLSGNIPINFNNTFWSQCEKGIEVNH